VPVRLLLAGFVLLLGLGAGLARADEEMDYGLETNRLARIEISGNKTFSSADLKDLLRIQEASWTRPLHVPRYQPHLVDTQVRLLKTFYRNRGFHQVEAGLDSITVEEGEGDVLHISVQEGTRTYIRRVVFQGDEALGEARLRGVLTLLEGSPAPADLNAFGGDIYAMLNLYRNETYLEARVVPEILISPDEDDSGYYAEVRYTIMPGRPHVVRQIELAGNLITHDNIITRELRIGPGEPLRWNAVEDSRRALLNTSLFRDVTIRPVTVDSLSGETDLMVTVIERKPAFYELGVGVGSLERVRVLAAWGHHNLWGTARRFEVRARGSWNVEDVIDLSPSFDQGQINYRADLRYVNPRLRDSRYSLDWEVFMKRETRGESGLNMFAYGTNLGTSWQASRRVRNSVFLGYKVTNPEVHPLAPQELKNRFAEVDPQADQVRSVNWAIFIDHRDDLFRPTTGMYTVGTAQLAGGPFGGDFSFVKWTASWQDYQQMLAGTVLAMRLKVGGTRPYGSSLDQGPDGVPYDDRFFAGGSSTVRGYRQNSLGPQVTGPDELDDLNFSSDVLLPDNPARGGNYLMLTNIEWRVPLPGLQRWKLAGVLFFEGGNVWSQIGDVRLRGFRLHSAPGDPLDPGSTKVWDYRYSWGTGLRLDTPVGPVRVDLGIPLKRVNYVDEIRNYQDPKRVWHFSLGYPF
jgi:outer membrane protein insertion porin family